MEKNAAKNQWFLDFLCAYFDAARKGPHRIASASLPAAAPTFCGVMPCSTNMKFEMAAQRAAPTLAAIGGKRAI